MTGTRLPRQRWLGVLDMPEPSLIFFAFLLNFVWEFLQVPFFQSLSRMPHWEAVKFCALATVGDAAIMLVAFWCIAVAARTRRWILNPDRQQLAGFVGLGVAMTIVLELSARSTGRWEYTDAMPVIPLLGVGLVPLLQWAILPMLTAWLVRRHLT